MIQAVFEFTLLTLLCGEGEAGPGCANLALLGRHVIVNVNRQGQKCAQGSAASLRLRGARGRYAPANQNPTSCPAQRGKVSQHLTDFGFRLVTGAPNMQR